MRGAFDAENMYQKVRTDNKRLQSCLKQHKMDTLKAKLFWQYGCV